MFEDLSLRNKNAKRLYLFIILLLLIIFIISLWYTIENKNSFDPTFFILSQNIIVSLATSIITAGFLIIFYSWLLPKENMYHQIEELHPQTTIELFDKALKSTNFWHYHGHIGRWVRIEVMPKLAEKAQRKGEKLKIQLVLLDPSNHKLCEDFANYRKTAKHREKELISAENVKAQLYTTIIVSLFYQQHCYNGLDIDVYLTNSFSGLRKDINEYGAFLTRVDPRAPAILAKANKIDKPIATLYSMFKTSFYYTKVQSWKLNFAKHSVDIKKEPSPDAVRKILFELNLISDESDISENLVRTVLELIKSDYHPYT